MSFPLVPVACTIAVLPCMALAHASFSRCVRGSRVSLYALPVILLLGFILWNSLFFSLGRAVAPEDIITGYGMFGFIAVGYTELFLNLYRGFTYTLIADLSLASSPTEESLRRNFADGLGEKGMIERRFVSLEEAGLVRRADGAVHLLPRGACVARASSAIRQALNLERGGGDLPPVS